jgi:hypothetical protein
MTFMTFGRDMGVRDRKLYVMEKGVIIMEVEERFLFDIGMIIVCVRVNMVGFAVLYSKSTVLKWMRN